ncbi:alpha/beta fold hydrolase [Actinomycetospora termitidis]|uniref:Alpha/beta hydrolase n=1 Tax=Actinomycetospora termitidis TaxID=3053470 RepID=A0ABT7MFR0_9PSEU|nr:alpha/beta hydrolase [Actinomycetospora sp. Odt1-22]MDL5158717.1 alpha/beta hydrolase [Actinomycetospora sp. Odt1-22]
MVTTRHVDIPGLRVHVATAGAGPAVLLLHGWPHTWRLWRDVIDALAVDHFVIAPDLRGIGGTDKPAGGYDLHTLADDAVGLLDALGVGELALVAGIDLGSPVAWMTAVRHRARVARLAVMESLLGRLPGAEEFLAGGPPWWFGFHAVPDLPEAVLAGRTDAYVDWFLRAGTWRGRGVDDDLRSAFLAAYRDPEGLRGGFAHYRALARNAELVAAAAAGILLSQPTLALGGATVGDALARQLAPITPDLRSEVLPECGHIVPADAPAALVERLRALLQVSPTTAGR